MNATGTSDFTGADQIHLQAAEGWLGLGDYLSASDELNQITPSLRSTPDVLNLRCEIYSAAENRPLAADAAYSLTQFSPEDEMAWLRYCDALHELQCTAQARDTLLQVILCFPDCALMRYNLARYECRLGNLDQAREHLAVAFTLRGGLQLCPRACDEPDLSPLSKPFRPPL